MNRIRWVLLMQRGTAFALRHPRWATGIVILLVVLIVIPLVGVVLVWSLNTLFNLGLPYTWKTILAAFLLTSAVAGTTQRARRR